MLIYCAAAQQLFTGRKKGLRTGFFIQVIAKAKSQRIFYTGFCFLFFLLLHDQRLFFYFELKSC